MSLTESRQSRNKRPYATRLPEPYSRRMMLCLRVSERSRVAVQRLASERAMSPSEYLAHLVNEHLNGVVRVRGLAPLGL
jgi:hypothetical protein